jgi:hypothetical protein
MPNPQGIGRVPKLKTATAALRYFAMLPQTRSPTCKNVVWLVFNLLCQRSSPDFSENENHVLRRIAL